LISPTAARTTSVSAIGPRQRRAGSDPDRMMRFSALRRIRVARWPSSAMPACTSASGPPRSTSSMTSSCRSIRLWLRRARLRNISPTLRRSAASRPASWTATRCTVLNACASRPISSLEWTAIGGADSLARSTCLPSSSRWTTPGSRPAVPTAAASSRPSGRISDRAVISASATASTNVPASSRLDSSALRSASCLTAALMAMTSSPSRCSTVRRRSCLTVVAANHSGAETASLVTRSPARAASTASSARRTSAPATVCSRSSRCSGVAAFSNWAV
jgi:hypothetical protein